jgi:hypothetical protein
MEVPTNTMIIITPKMNVLQIPILDEYSPIDRPHPSRAPRAANASKTDEPDNSFQYQNHQAKAAHFTSPLQQIHIEGYSRSRGEDVGRSAHVHGLGTGEQDEEEKGEGSFLDKAQQRNRRREGSTQRSPAFALHKGFPPNSHVGLGVAGGVNGNAAAAAAGNA